MPREYQKCPRTLDAKGQMRRPPSPSPKVVPSTEEQEKAQFQGARGFSGCSFPLDHAGPASVQSLLGARHVHPTHENLIMVSTFMHKEAQESNLLMTSHL